MSNIIVFGAAGQLGQCLKRVSEQRGTTLVFPAEAEANILDTTSLEAVFARYQPKFCVNCAAYTAVDKAEDEADLSAMVNETGVENIARLCAKHGTTLIQISTDFVFEGNVIKLLTEEDPANPVNVYGLTKLRGEQVIGKYTSTYFTIRTSWLYSEYGNNFVKTMLRLGREKPELNIIADQVGTPTYAIDLAGCILDVIASGTAGYGIYHYSNEGVTSWFDFARSIFDIAGITVKTNPVPTSAYVTRAKRPQFSVMDKTKIKSTFGMTIPYWRTSLEKCVANLMANEL
ncbi:dTDP-4-dehydrorhamnose reductase [Pedobacter sp. HMF7056]|uniref:dTDP-4-dehydrorhamnose reductase n=2 Tax=Hufsiella ginkgonis TaxID=2695274 RepID=A0A7K1XUG9_9SPHI|nr:dTDP-4-dehydrorhamnose reductase [Hufsiella ginkgonis]